MPPSNLGERPSTATACPWIASPTLASPLSSIAFSSTPLLNAVPRTTKLSARGPQASRSQSRLDSKPPAAATIAFAATRSVFPPRFTIAARKRSASISRFTASAS